ncbi:MAG: phenylalanine--tRNA ligase subunit beta [Clostridiales bacterium]|jgi:phenylalanyl-tRNA synthetase beta chain|nr:phenylalanine--tRNA ligase subunit beta [Eubacteriales bacterium]MDH7564953.1 phenylalanine--tRNA ligase subunit beta [Clostridiales bacterium]
MKVPLNWLRDYVDINVSPKEFANALTMSGSKVEGLETLGEEISRVVVGKILSLEKHPQADKLQVSKVDVGNEVLQIVTGAQNIRVGDYIPVALDGSTLPGGKKIEKSMLRGVESNGMMCSIQELGLSLEDYPNAAEHGIFILEKDLPLGKDIREVIGLNDTVVEFEITPNRPDCLSMTGIAREAAVALNTRFTKPEIAVKEEGGPVDEYASVEVKDRDLCLRYAARVVRGVKIAPSPKWMRERLRAAGVRPINNIVDITNYVMLEMGQPMHAFDMDYLQEKRIVVRRASEGETIKTLDGQERKLDSSMLVIADAKRPVGVAGVMGGENSEITEKTRDILFESAVFDGTSIRLTSKKLGLRTEASSRYEKGLDVENAIAAVNRAAQLVEELGAGTVCKGVIDCYGKKWEQRSIKFRPERINSLLGTSIKAADMLNILKALEFEYDEANMLLKVPSFRADVEREADLAEEVARFYGYNNIEPTLLPGKTTTVGKKTFKQKVEDIIKNTMAACGLYEIYTFSFTSPKVFDRINLPADSPLRNAVVISNPLGEDFSIMRTTTIPNMLEVIATNYNRRMESVKLFELSHVYLPQGTDHSKLPHEKQVLTLGMYGNVDFYDLKGIVEDLLSALGIKDFEFGPEKDFPAFHPGRTARLVVNQQGIGVLGEIHPEVAENFEGPERTYIGVIEVEPLIRAASLTAQYKPLPKFPAVSRDIAMLVRDGILVKQIESVIREKGGEIVEAVKLFDVYKGKQVPEGMKSVAYSITFRTRERTLTDEEVNRAVHEILEGLKNNFGAQLRE